MNSQNFIYIVNCFITKPLTFMKRSLIVIYYVNKINGVFFSN